MLLEKCRMCALFCLYLLLASGVELLSHCFLAASLIQGLQQFCKKCNVSWLRHNTSSILTESSWKEKESEEEIKWGENKNHSKIQVGEVLDGQLIHPAVLRSVKYSQAICHLLLDSELPETAMLLFISGLCISRLNFILILIRIPNLPKSQRNTFYIVLIYLWLWPYHLPVQTPWLMYFLPILPGNQGG